MSGYVMRPALICKNEHMADLPDVRDAEGVMGRIHCENCGEPMILISYAVVDREPDFGSVSYHRRQATGTWWRK